MTYVCFIFGISVLILNCPNNKILLKNIINNFMSKNKIMKNKTKTKGEALFSSLP